MSPIIGFFNEENIILTYCNYWSYLNFDKIFEEYLKVDKNRFVHAKSFFIGKLVVHLVDFKG